MKRYTYLLLAIAIIFIANGCKELEDGNTKSYPGPDYVGFEEESVTYEETAGEISLVLLSTNPNGASVTVSASSEDAVADEDYTLGTASVSFAAGEYQQEVTLTLIDNEEIDGQKSVTLSLSSDDAEIGLSGNSPDLVVVINDDDFYCPANKLQITQGTDVGFSSAPASIASVASPGDECITFEITSGADPLFGAGAGYSFNITVVPDGENSDTGTIETSLTTELRFPDGDGGFNVSSYTLDIIGDDSGYSGTASFFDLTTGELGFDYVLKQNGATIFPGRLVYE
ncbi:Calx-beta domain-containing protein [Ekhidna sp.]|uniref:Calx-beta domain-containing protein n=1 Tax=Ekhidna sp. TaxID=2608089 RepID=UPI003C7BC96B